MTSAAPECAATILCTAKQTRFHTSHHHEIDIEGLEITVSAGDAASSGKGKAKARLQATEILTGARLRLQEGRRYALVGRNGTGKSTLLRAIADKLIPGIPEDTRIAMLRQTTREDAVEDCPDSAEGLSPSILHHVVNKTTVRGSIEREIKVLADGIGTSDAYGPVRALRTLKHDRLQRNLFRLEKEARLRSGARGAQARKALVAHEKSVAESERLLRRLDVGLTAEALRAETQEAADMLASLQLQVELSRLTQTEARARSILAGLGFSDDRQAKPLASMSGGWQMRAALATALLQDADLLLLDEPTKFLDLLGIIWLQRHLQSLKTTTRKHYPPSVVLVSHDRDFTSRYCTGLLMLKDRQLVYFQGDLATFEASQAERSLWLRRMRDTQERQKAHLEKTIQQNMRAGQANDDQEQGGRFKLNRDLVGWHLTARDDIDVPPEERPVIVSLPEPLDLRFPGSLLSLERASFRYDAPAAAPTVLRDVSLDVGMGDRIGILGLNGTGKSTLVKLLVGKARPTSGGAVATHPRLGLGYYAQHAVEALKAQGRADPTLTALTLLTRDCDGRLDEADVRGLLSELGLPGRIASHTPLSRLSGGQLVRCELARLLWRRPHCLVLDEITTHLDYETVTALRAALSCWVGAIVLISHDRWFMRGAVEGSLDDDGDDEGSEDDELWSPRRRVTYRLKDGTLSPLQSGVDEFEALVEKEASKLLQQLGG